MHWVSECRLHFTIMAKPASDKEENNDDDDIEILRVILGDEQNKEKKGRICTIYTIIYNYIISLGRSGLRRPELPNNQYRKKRGGFVGQNINDKDAAEHKQGIFYAQYL